MRAATTALLATLAVLAAAPLPAPAAPPPGISVTDPSCGNPDLAASDALALTVDPVPEGLRFKVTLAADLARGLFTCVHVHLDLDDDKDTGIGGSELWFRAITGSRFRPNDREGAGPPRLSMSTVIEQKDVAADRTSNTWINRALPGAPDIDGATMAFTVPVDQLDRGTEFVGKDIAFRVVVETWIGDPPLLVDHVAGDAGLPLVLDGDAGDWSGAPEDEDAAGDLPASLQCMDLVRLRVDHDDKRLLVCVDMAAPDFAAPLGVVRDVARTENLNLLAEPADSDYEASRRLVIPRGRREGKGATGDWVASGAVIEAALPRTGLEARTRVLAWTEVVRRDTIPDKDSLKIPRRKR